MKWPIFCVTLMIIMVNWWRLVSNHLHTLSPSDSNKAFFKWKKLKQHVTCWAAFQSSFNDGLIGRNGVLLFQTLVDEFLRPRWPYLTFLDTPAKHVKIPFFIFLFSYSALSEIIIENLCLCKLPAAVTNQFLFSIVWWFNFLRFSFVLTILFDNLLW